MSPRLDYYKVAPDAIKPLLAAEKYIAECGLEPILIELVKTRASQINGCAYCLHMHTHDARAKGETEARLYLLDAWQESAMYTPRERAALAWTDSVTRVAQTHVPEEVFNELRAHFTELEIVNLTLLVATHQCVEPHRHQFPSPAPRRRQARCATGLNAPRDGASIERIGNETAETLACAMLAAYGRVKCRRQAYLGAKAVGRPCLPGSGSGTERLSTADQCL